MQTSCPSCRIVLTVPDSAVGQPVACPNCRSQFTVAASDPLADLSQAVQTASYQPPGPGGYAAGYPHTMLQRPPSQAGKVCAILSIIFGAVAFLLCPIVFGLAGIILGAISISTSKNKSLGTVGLIISVLGLILGTILSVIVWSHVHR